MENKEGLSVNEGGFKISLTDEEKLEYLKYVRKQLIKLLNLIEGEKEGGASAETFFGAFLFDLGSADWLFGNRLSLVIVKLHGLFKDGAYRSLEHKTIKNKIFESRGMVDGLIKEIGGSSTPSNRG